jgi:short-subunit dehydrogenase
MDTTLLLVGRSVEEMKTVAAPLESEHGVLIRIYPTDLGQPGATTKLWAELTGAGVIIDVLVNNAGVGLHGELWEQNADALRQLLVLKSRR